MTIIIAILGFCGIVGGLIWHYHINSGDDDPLAVGAVAKITALRPNKLADNTYTFGITVENVGTSSMVNFSTAFAITYSATVLTETQENEQYYNRAASFISEHERDNLHSEIATSLSTDNGLNEVMPDGHLNEDEFNEITMGNKKAYIFATVVYFDLTTPRGTYYVAQYCEIYQPLAKAFSVCIHPNFDKLIEHF